MNQLFLWLIDIDIISSSLTGCIGPTGHSLSMPALQGCTHTMSLLHVVTVRCTHTKTNRLPAGFLCSQQQPPPVQHWFNGSITISTRHCVCVILGIFKCIVLFSCHFCHWAAVSEGCIGLGIQQCPSLFWSFIDVVSAAVVVVGGAVVPSGWDGEEPTYTNMTAHTQR